MIKRKNPIGGHSMQYILCVEYVCRRNIQRGKKTKFLPKTMIV